MIRQVGISDLVLSRDGDQKPGMPALKPGQVVRATVLGPVPPNLTQLKIGAKRVLAETALPLRQGQEIQLKVASTGRLQVLKLVPDAETAPALLKALVGSLSEKGALPLFRELAGAMMAEKGVSTGSQGSLADAKGATIGLQGATDILQGSSASPQGPTASPQGPTASPQGPAAGQHSLSASLLARDPEFRPLVDLLLKLSLTSGKSDPSGLKQAVARGGMQFESSLGSLFQAGRQPAGETLRSLMVNDLKGLVLGLEDRLEAQTRALVETLRTASDALKNALHGTSPTARLTGLIKALETASQDRTAPLPVRVLESATREMLVRVSVDLQTFSKGMEAAGIRRAGTVKEMTALSESLENLAARVEKDTSAVISPLREFIETTQILQTLNRESMESGRFFLLFPILSDQSLTFGQMLVDLGGRGRQGKEEKRLITVALLLSMTQLGPIRVDAGFLDRSMSASFQAADPETVSLIQAMLPNLKERLISLGFRVQILECRQTPEPEISGTTLITEAVEHPDGMLNIVI